VSSLTPWPTVSVLASTGSEPAFLEASD
jgi:hypothetical protein